LNEIARATLDLARTELMIRHVAPITDFATDLPMIEGDKLQLWLVVLNLVLNAADATTKAQTGERTITIRTDLSDGTIRLYVVDNGSGIAGEHLKAVLDPLWSVKASGMGMSLAICKSIVALHRGSIFAANNPEGGATFCVSFPHGQKLLP
jgi:signal transduction histidine kinase